MELTLRGDSRLLQYVIIVIRAIILNHYQLVCAFRADYFNSNSLLKSVWALDNPLLSAHSGYIDSDKCEQILGLSMSRCLIAFNKYVTLSKS